MKVLLVSPAQPDLPSQFDEVQAIINSGLTVHPLLGQVRHADVLREMVARLHDVLWLATHGGDEGILLSDGILSASLLTSMARGRVRLVVLNTCASIQVAQMIQQESGASVICTVTDVPDREAFQTGALLARALAETEKPEIAYERSKPGGNRTYLMLTAKGGKMDDDTGVTGLGVEMRELTKAMYELRSEMALLKHRMEKVEEASYTPRPLMQSQQVNAIVGTLVVIALMLLYGLYLLSGGAA